MTAPFSSFPGDTAEAELARPVPSGGGMAARIRAFDWGKTPLGPIESWPQSRKTIVDLMLGSEVIMAAPWGPEGILLYNDAYARLIGPRGATALGRPVFEALPELRELLEPRFAEVRAGRTLRVSDFLYPFVRNTALEDAWFDISYTPVRDEQGKVVAVLAFIVETTERVLSERRRQETEAALHRNEERQAFLLKLSDSLRPLADPVEIETAAARLLVEHVGAKRAIYLEFEGDGATPSAVILSQYARGVPPFPSRIRYADFARGFPSEALENRQTIVVADTASDPRLEDDVRAAWLGTEVAAVIAVSLVKQGRVVAAFGLHNAVSRAWMPLEIRLVEDVADRTWAAVERARAEAALAASEEKYRTIFDSIDRGLP